MARFQKAVQYIKKNYSKPITVYDIADLAGICRSHLYRLFMQYIDVSPKQYLTDYRIKTAHSLLQKRPYPVDVLSLKVGIKDSDRFSSQFKRVYGVTPFALMNSGSEKKNKPVGMRLKKRPVRRRRGH